MFGPVARALLEAGDGDGLTEHLSRTRERFGAAVVGFRLDVDQPAVSHVPNGAELAKRLGWPDGFLDDWLDRQAGAAFPFFELCRNRHVPFVWHAHEAGDNPAARHLARFDLAGGITVPFRGPAGRAGCVSWIVRGTDRPLFQLAEQHGAEMTLAAHLFLDRLHALDPKTPQVRLTPRERECLAWAAAGKTDSEIGAILDRSPETARFHIKRAAAKLGTVNRTQTVVRALELGVIPSR